VPRGMMEMILSGVCLGMENPALGWESTGLAFSGRVRGEGSSSSRKSLSHLPWVGVGAGHTGRLDG